MPRETSLFHPRRLSTYLNDHLAVAVAGVAVSRRTLASNEGTAYEPVLRRIAGDLEADERLLRQVMQALGVGEDRLKQRLAQVGERLGRLKPNGSLRGYSPLSRVVELEALMVVTAVLRATWATLDEVLGAEAGVPDVGSARERAERNLQELERHRPSATREALTAA